MRSAPAPSWRGSGWGEKIACRIPMIVMAGLVPAIHVLNSAKTKDVDARHETGHDERKFVDVA